MSFSCGGGGGDDDVGVGGMANALALMRVYKFFLCSLKNTRHTYIYLYVFTIITVCLTDLLRFFIKKRRRVVWYGDDSSVLMLQRRARDVNFILHFFLRREREEDRKNMKEGGRK